MAFAVLQWPATQILVVRAEGSGSINESSEVLAALERQRLVPQFVAVLFDLRLLDYLPTPDEARDIAARYGVFGARHRCRMAYVATPGAQYGITRMVEMLSQQHGVAAATFTSFDLALQWLGEAVRDVGA